MANSNTNRYRGRPQMKRIRINSETEDDPPREKTFLPKIKDSTLPLYRAYRKASTAYVKSTHHREFLTSCIDQGTTPRGLRPNIQPQVPNPTTEFTLQWEEALIQFGQKLTRILLQYWTEREETTKSESERCHRLLTEKAPTTEIDDIDSIVKQLNEELKISLNETRVRKTEDIRASNSRTRASTRQ